MKWANGMLKFVRQLYDPVFVLCNFSKSTHSLKRSSIDRELARPSLVRHITSYYDADPLIHLPMAPWLLSGSITNDDASFFARACERSGPISRSLSRVLLLSNW